MGEIKNLARHNVRDILNGGFSDELTITPIGLEAITISGTTSVHSTTFDSDGLPVIGPNSHCTFSELDLTDLGVVTRNAKGDLDILNWQVSFSDQFGIYTCKIKEIQPDRGLGIIVALLSQIQP